MTIAETIKVARQKKKMTHADLAAKIHVSPQLVGHWETAEREPSAGILLLLARELRFSLNKIEVLPKYRRKPEGVQNEN